MTGSYRQILRSSSIIGGASVVSIAIGLIRNKAVAIILGPAGIGLIGLLQNVMATAGVVASLGLGTVGTRQIAEADSQGSAAEIASARFALRSMTMMLAVVGGLVFFLLRAPIAELILGDRQLSVTVGWLSIGVAFSVAAGSQGALLAGLRRIGDLARLSILSTGLSTIIGVASLYAYGQDALIPFILSVPLCSLLLGNFFVSRLPRVLGNPASIATIWRQWSALAKLGASFMLAGVVSTLAQLIVRTMVNRHLGPAALGQFEASWIVSMTYIGFVLKAMGTDYYPRLTAAINDAATVNRMVNEQTEVALLLSGPLFLILLGFSPWIVTILYSGEFQEASDILRWQVLGDILKVASWPLGFIILASGEGRIFLGTESIATGVFVLLSWVGLPIIGVQATGVSFLMMYVVLLPLVYWLAWKKTRFRWTKAVALQLVTLLLCAIVIILLGAHLPWVGGIGGAVFASLFGVIGLAHLSQLITLPAPLHSLSRVCFKLLKTLGVGRGSQ